MKKYVFSYKTIEQLDDYYLDKRRKYPNGINNIEWLNIEIETDNINNACELMLKKLVEMFGCVHQSSLEYYLHDFDIECDVFIDDILQKETELIPEKYQTDLPI